MELPKEEVGRPGAKRLENNLQSQAGPSNPRLDEVALLNVRRPEKDGGGGDYVSLLLSGDQAYLCQRTVMVEGMPEDGRRREEGGEEESNLLHMGLEHFFLVLFPREAKFSHVCSMVNRPRDFAGSLPEAWQQLQQ